MANCKCNCMNHVCDCANSKCEKCGCSPSRIIATAARIVKCNVHSINYPYGQTCPECSQGNKPND